MVGGNLRYQCGHEPSPDICTQIRAVSMKILALSARQVVSVLEQCTNVLLSQIFPISLFNEAL